MPDIPFTQYLRPNGERRAERIERPQEIAAKAQAIIDRGLRFECEVLTTGWVSFTVSDDEKDYDIEICANGPLVPAAVDRLINRYYDRL